MRTNRFSRRVDRAASKAWAETLETRLLFSIPSPPTFASNFLQTWAQDFTVMTTDAQIGVNASTMGTGTWIAHKPGGGDWADFISPKGHDDPFGIDGNGSGSNYLTIRAQHDPTHTWNNWNGDYTMGLLSSMDGAGAGFAQKYGYFEVSMQTPGGANTWPSFWLMDAPALTDHTLQYAAEIDVTELYGNGNPNVSHMTWHNWAINGLGGTTGGGSSTATLSGATTGYHTYGVDIEPTTITWYFDRQAMWSAPTYAAANRPMFLMIDLAMGGGTFNNATHDGYDWNLTPSPSDLKVQYVAVWASPNTPGYPAPTGAPTNLVAAAINNTKVGLTWADNSGNEGGYKVERATDSAFTQNLTLVATTAANATSYNDPTATPSTTYYYRVRATNAGGDTANSNTATVTTDLTITDLNPMADAFVKDGTPTTNYGTLSTLEVRSSGTGNLRKDYLRFDGSALTSSTATDATMSLIFTAGVAAARTYQLYGIRDTATGENFGETTINWSNAIANNTDGSFTSDATLLATVTLAAGATSAVFNSASLTAFINSDTNNVLTFAVYKASNTGLDTLKSREAATGKPLLEVAAMPDPPPGPTDLTPTADSFIKDGAATTNFGTQSTLEVRSSGASNLRKAYVRFDGTAVTNAATDATLNVNFAAGVGGARTYQLYGITDGTTGESFGETSITWNNAVGNNTDGTFTANAVLLATVSLATGATSATFESAGLTSFINADTNNVFTFVIYKASNTGLDTLISREAATGKPLLEVTYGTGPMLRTGGTTTISTKSKVAGSRPVSTPVSATSIAFPDSKDKKDDRAIMKSL